MSDDFYYNMYGGGSTKKPVEKSPEEKAKMATRVAAGMKAQNSHMHSIDVGGQLMNLPRAEYVQQLETQLRETRNKVRELETKQQRLIKANNRIMDKLRQIENELANKIDIR